MCHSLLAVSCIADLSVNVVRAHVCAQYDYLHIRRCYTRSFNIKCKKPVPCVEAKILLC